MNLSFAFFINNILLGVGLAMDAFSVSVANGLNEPCMRKRRMWVIAGVFAGFQFVMPLIGWFCVTTIAHYFVVFEKFIPWIALGLLGYIGGKMLYDGIKGECDEECGCAIGFVAILIQGIATSIDALSVGFTIAEYNFMEAIYGCLIIGIVTFVICLNGLRLGKKASTKFAGKSGILGGAILIFIGLEIFVTSLF